MATLYYRLRYVVTAERALDAQRGRLRSAVDIATSRYGAGVAPQSDPLEARVALARLDAEGAELTAEESTLRSDLRAVRGVRVPEQLTITPIAAESVTAILATAGAEHAAHLQATDPLAAHPRIEARQAELDGMRETARVERLMARPDFEVSVRYGARPLGADFFSAFLGLRVPLWAGRKQRRLAEAATFDVTASQQGLDEERTALTAELERTLAQAQAGAARLQLLVDTVLPLTQEGVEAARRGYGTGQTDFQRVLTAEDVHYRAQLEATEVAAEHLTHLVMLTQLLATEDTP